MGNQFAGSYEIEPTCWHLFVFVGTSVSSSEIPDNWFCGVTTTALRNLESKRDSELFGVLFASDALAARLRGIVKAWVLVALTLCHAMPIGAGRDRLQRVLVFGESVRETPYPPQVLSLAHPLDR